MNEGTGGSALVLYSIADNCRCRWIWARGHGPVLASWVIMVSRPRSALPQLLESAHRIRGEVEIARIEIASTTFDVTSLFAKFENSQIHYRVVDEYEGDTLTGTSEMTFYKPLTLGKMADFFLGAWSLVDVLEMNFEADVESAFGFFTAKSEFYPGPRVSPWRFRPKTGLCGRSTPGSSAGKVVLLGEVLKLRWRGPTPPLHVTLGSSAPCFPIPTVWVEGVASLDDRDPPSDVPRHRWRLFVDDCKRFVASDWAGRAAELGWDAMSLFGCAPKRPLDYSGSAGLLWALNGGRLVQLHRDWAVIDVPVNRFERVFYRRNVNVTKITLPWRKRD
jgi:hypothetical protein